MFKKPTLTQFYAIFSLINVQKYFAWLSFRSFPAGMPIFSQIRVGHVTWGPHFGDSLVHPLLKSSLEGLSSLNKAQNQSALSFLQREIRDTNSGAPFHILTLLFIPDYLKYNGPAAAATLATERKLRHNKNSLHRRRWAFALRLSKGLAEKVSWYST